MRRELLQAVQMSEVCLHFDMNFLHRIVTTKRFHDKQENKKHNYKVGQARTALYFNALFIIQIMH